MKITDDAELIEATTRVLFEMYRGTRLANGDANCVSYEQMKAERPILFKAWIAAGRAAVGVAGDLAAAWARHFIELGPRPERQYAEPTDEEQKRIAAWDAKWSVLVERARSLGLIDDVVEPVAKE